MSVWKLLGTRDPFLFLWILVKSMKLIHYLSIHSGFPGCSVVKNCLKCRRHKRCKFNPWVGKISWRRKWQSTQYSCLGTPMGRGAWQTAVHGVARVGHDWATKPPMPPGLSLIHTLPASRKVPAPSWYFRTILLLPLLPLSPSFSWRNGLEQQFQAVLSK